MRKIIAIVLAVSMLVICICGCSKKSKLEDYITNYDEVVAVLQEQFGSNNITIEDYKPNKEQTEAGWQNEIDQQISSLTQFGNGKWYLVVNDINVTVKIENHIAYLIVYDNGSDIVRVGCPSAEQLSNQTELNINNGG